MSLGLDVPTHFVVPKERFNLKLGINMCEVEFPAYFNFFIKQTSVDMICTPEVEKTVRQIINETLEGPLPQQLYVDSEYPDTPPRSGRFSFEARPDHEKEINFFKEPRNGREIKTDTVMQFTNFKPYEAVKQNVSDEVHRVVATAISMANSIADQQPVSHTDDSSGSNPTQMASSLMSPIYVAILSNGLEIVDVGEEYAVIDDGITVAVVQSFMSTWAPAPKFMLGAVPNKVTDPPHFGVTVLGSSHGFDPKGSTSGFVLWVHKKGIMVDPPPNATEILQAAGIIPSMISGIILTHCHSDHDAGAFQKILKEGRITLITTQTIFDSFIRKYSVISGFAEPFLLRLFEPRIVKIGELVHWGGGTLRFFYSLHALPCIGFEAMLAGKTFVYSADTYYDPQGLADLRDKGYLSPQRCQALLDFPWDYDVVLHEAGIPPIHTPVTVLEQLPDAVKKNLYIIHIAANAAAQTSLRHAQPGVENTIVIETPPHEHATSAAILQLLRSTDIFRHFTISQASDMLQLCRHCTYEKDDYICRAGEVGTHFFVILTGFCTVKLSKHLGEGKDLHRALAKTDSSSSDGDSTPGSSELPSYIEEANEHTENERPLSSRSSASISSSTSGASDDSVEFNDHSKIFGSGDYLGELALLTENSIRSADIVALSRLTLIKLDTHAFRYLLDTTPGLQYRMERLSKIRCSLSWKAIGANSVLSRLRSTQRSQLQSYMQVMHVKKGTRLWEKGQPVKRAYLLACGQLEFHEMRQELMTPFKKGAFFISISSMMAQRLEEASDQDNGRGSKKRKSLIASKLTLVAKTDADLYYIEAEDMLEFLEGNPGILIQVIESVVLE